MYWKKVLSGGTYTGRKHTLEEQEGRRARKRQNANRTFYLPGTAALCVRNGGAAAAPCKLPLQSAPCNKNFPMTFQGKYCILGSKADTLTAVAAEGWRIVS